MTFIHSNHHAFIQQIVNIYIFPGTILDIGHIAENKVEVILALWNLHSIWEGQQQTDQLCSVLDGDTCCGEK